MTLVSICAASQLIVTKASYWCPSPYNGILAWHPCSTELWKSTYKKQKYPVSLWLADSTMLSLLCLNVSFERAMAWLASSSKSACCGHVTSAVFSWSCCLSLSEAFPEQRVHHSSFICTRVVRSCSLFLHWMYLPVFHGSRANLTICNFTSYHKDA